MLIRMYQIEISKNDKLLKRFNWGGPELLTLSCESVRITMLVFNFPFLYAGRKYMLCILYVLV